MDVRELAAELRARSDEDLAQLLASLGDRVERAERHHQRSKLLGEPPHTDDEIRSFLGRERQGK